MSSSMSLPGLHSPAAGFEAPFDLLEACHERVHRSLALLGRLVDHVGEKGHDVMTRSAAADVLRYFDIAAPLHHEDEELHVFPPLLARDDPALRVAVERLRADHRAMSEAWRDLRAVLLHWRDAPEPTPLDAVARELATRFVDLYGPHIALEESLAYPAVRDALDAATLAAMGQEMQARRRTG